MNEHAPPPAPYYLYPALHKEHPTTLAGALACLAGRPMLFSSAPLLSPPDKAGAEWNPSRNFLALYKLIYLRQKEKLSWMIYVYTYKAYDYLFNTGNKSE